MMRINHLLTFFFLNIFWFSLDKTVFDQLVFKTILLYCEIFEKVGSGK